MDQVTDAFGTGIAVTAEEDEAFSRAQSVEIICADGLTVIARKWVSAADVDYELNRLNAAARASGLRIVWRRPVSYSPPINEVCMTCGSKHCLCRTDGHDRRDDMGSRR